MATETPIFRPQPYIAIGPRTRPLTNANGSQMTTVENVRSGNATQNAAQRRPAAAAKNPGGHRYLPGHPHYPRKQGSASQASVFKRRSAKIFAAIVAERDGELTTTQTIHARNAADLGAAIAEMKDKRKAGEFV